MTIILPVTRMYLAFKQELNNNAYLTELLREFFILYQDTQGFVIEPDLSPFSKDQATDLLHLSKIYLKDWRSHFDPNKDLLLSGRLKDVSLLLDGVCFDLEYPI